MDLYFQLDDESNFRKVVTETQYAELLLLATAEQLMLVTEFMLREYAIRRVVQNDYEVFRVDGEVTADSAKIFFYHVMTTLSIVLTPDEMRRILSNREPLDESLVIASVLDNVDDDSIDDLWITLWSAGSTITGICTAIYQIRGWYGFVELFQLASGLVDRMIDHAANSLASARRWWAGDQSIVQTVYDVVPNEVIIAGAAQAGYRAGGPVGGLQSGLLMREVLNNVDEIGGPDEIARQVAEGEISAMEASWRATGARGWGLAGWQLATELGPILGGPITAAGVGAIALRLGEGCSTLVAQIVSRRASRCGRLQSSTGSRRWCVPLSKSPCSSDGCCPGRTR